MKLVLASRNRKKIKELETFLSEISSDITVLSLDDIGFHDEIVEDGATFAENSRIKASVPAGLGYIGVADDSGLEVDALGGEPGVYSARYSGEGATDEKNNKKLLAALAGVPDEKRTARFRTVVTCIFPDGDEIQAEGVCEGRILESPRGQDGFGYDPLFWYEPLGKTFAELTPDEKNSVSHRGRAMREFAAKLRAHKF
ncbi:MAG: XTP/dITP diphosphatase [Candidatus Flemingiibacterium sp.]